MDYLEPIVKADFWQIFVAVVLAIIAAVIRVVYLKAMIARSDRWHNSPFAIFLKLSTSFFFILIIVFYLSVFIFKYFKIL